jgi:hypothetical protein
VSKRDKKNQEKKDAIKTDKKLDSNRVNCPVCGASIPADGLAVHNALAH